MIYIEPHAGPAPIEQVIADARHSVDLSVYYLSSRPILQALAAAHARGVDVRVLLDGKPYGMRPGLVQKEWRAVRATGASVQRAPARFEARPGRYAFLHNKYVCNGHRCAIGTANYDYSAFHYNREYIDVTRNPAVVQAARTVFQADWTNRPAGTLPHRILVLSPGSETRIAAIIDQPGPVSLESEEMGNDPQILQAIAAKGRLARIILPAGISPTDQRNVRWLRARGVQIRLLPKRPIYLHAKIIVGPNISFIGSENYSRSSLDLNREMGMRLRNPAERRILQAQFDRDWAAAARSTSAEYRRRDDRYEPHWHRTYGR
ncbi:phospholipase D-like domain-containing protein [Thiomonas sp.]